MAQSTVTITIFPFPKGIDNTQRMTIARGTFSLSAGTYPQGGLPLHWTSVQNANSETINLSTEATPNPFEVDVFSAAYNTDSGTSIGAKGPSGYVYMVDNTQGNLHIFQMFEGGASGFSGPLSELAPGSTLLPAMLDDVIQFTAVFVRG